MSFLELESAMNRPHQENLEHNSVRGKSEHISIYISTALKPPGKETL